MPSYGERYDEHIPPNDFIDQDPLLKELIAVHKSVIQMSRTSHNKKNYCGFDVWADEFVNLKASEELSRRRYFAYSSDPFELLQVDEDWEAMYQKYDISYDILGKP